MKFQIILICALVALALAKKDKVKDTKEKEVKITKEDIKEENEDKPEDDGSYLILTPPGLAKDAIQKESVMDWESSYGSYPAGVEIIRGVGPSVNPLKDLYPGLTYPGYLHPGYLHPGVIPYGVRRVWNPEDYYNHYGNYPVA